MNALALAIGSALWLGILTSISPCPLASNVAAVAWISRNVTLPRRVLAAGTAYALGRAITYVALGVIVVTGLLSVPGVSFFLQEKVSQVLGPVLIVTGVLVAGWITLPLPSWTRGRALGERAGMSGSPGAVGMGMLFALSFCPVSAGIYFGGLIPLASTMHSPVLLPAVYGLGTALPVIVIAVMIALGVQAAGRAFRALHAIERVARPVTAGILILAGGYLVVTHLLPLDR